MKCFIRSFTYVSLAAAMLLISSCATLSPSGVGRVRNYTFESARLPEAFDGYKVAFVSDLHFPSKFTTKRLRRVTAALQEISPDAFMLGGDYVTADSCIHELFASLSSVKAKNGIFAVLGNHERENKGLIERAMNDAGITLLADSVVSVARGCDTIFFAGVYDSFKYDSLVVQPSESVPDSCFTLLLCHTPDYAERSRTNADIVLSGHTHGGQVSLFGLYTPVKNSRYGSRFLRGRNKTSTGTTIITTNGVGTSRRKIRFCVPSEIVVVTLKSLPSR